MLQDKVLVHEFRKGTLTTTSENLRTFQAATGTLILHNKCHPLEVISKFLFHRCSKQVPEKSVKRIAKVCLSPDSDKLVEPSTV